MNNLVRIFSLTSAGIGALNLNTDHGLHLIVLGVIVFLLSFIKPGGSDVRK
jgi:hypothetical protein